MKISPPKVALLEEISELSMFTVPPLMRIPPPVPEAVFEVIWVF